MKNGNAFAASWSIFDRFLGNWYFEFEAEMKKRILDYLQLSLQGIGIASLGTLNIYEPKSETLIFGCTCFLCGLIITIFNK